MIACSPQASALVIEYLPDGSIVVNGGVAPPAVQDRPAVPRPVSLTTESKDEGLRGLARAIGRQYAEAPGVRRAGLDAEGFARLFVALIDQESRFDPKAVSAKGANGLGQLMPETARDLGVADTFDPVQNLSGAARYLVAQLGRFGSVELALAAYNAGPGQVIQYGGVPPFRETKEFVRRVTAAASATPATTLVTSPEPAKTDVEETSVWEFAK